MSSQGLNPKVNWLNLAPQSADPSNPQEGDIFYSDGTSRLEGPWVYQNATWAQFSTGAAITTVNNLTLTPQASDPGSPATGMLFYSNGTSRAAGLWAYNGTGWVQVTGVRYQEFTHKQRYNVRAASTANVIISGLDAGDSFGGVILVAGNEVLLKNQTTTSENGVYLIQTGVGAIRVAAFDSASELTYAQIFVTEGTNANIRYFQTNVLTSLSDAQAWGTSAPTYNLTVPQDVYEIDVLGLGGGGGGGGGGAGNDGANNGGNGGGGGAGTSLILASKLRVAPGSSLTIAVGLGGAGGASNSAGSAGGATTISSLVGPGISSVYFPGANGGAAGVGNGGGTGIGGSQYAVTISGVQSPFAGGDGNATLGIGARASNPGAAANFIYGGIYGTGAAAGNPVAPVDNDPGGPGAGGGSSSFGLGGAGANFAPNGAGVGNSGNAAPGANYGAGGGGGGGGPEAGGRAGGRGGNGTDGYVKISWS